MTRDTLREALADAIDVVLPVPSMLDVDFAEQTAIELLNVLDESARAALRASAEATPGPVDARQRAAFVNFVRLWWSGPHGFPVVAAGNQSVADEDFEDMERDLAKLGLRLAAAPEEDK